MTGRVSLHLSKDGGVSAHNHVVATMGPKGQPFVKLFSINFHLNHHRGAYSPSHKSDSPNLMGRGEILVRLYTLIWGFLQCKGDRQSLTLRNLFEGTSAS